jgi:hypothetical protein
MTLQSSGLISLSDIAVELGRASNAYISMDETAVRTLAGVPTGVISLSDFYGKSNELVYNLSSTYQNANLRTIADGLGYTGQVTTVKINVLNTITSSSTSIPAIEVGSWPAGVNLIVSISAYITGKGGAGGGYNAPGGAGGHALKATNGISGGSIRVDMLSGGYLRAGGGGGGGGNNTTQHSGGTIYDRSDNTIYGGSGGRGAGTDGEAQAGGSRAGAGGNYGANGGSGMGGASGGSGGFAYLVSGNAPLPTNWTNGGNYSGLVG